MLPPPGLGIELKPKTENSCEIDLEASRMHIVAAR